MKLSTSLAALAVVALAANPVLAQDRMTAVSFGGAYGAAQKKHMVDPFMEQSDVEILFEDYSGGIAEMKAQVEAGNVQWDAVDIEVIDLERACAEGLLEVLDHSELPAAEDGTPASEDFYGEALASECGVGVIYWATVFAYNTDTIGDTAPTSIADFFDTEAIPGKRAMRKRPQVNLEWALMADGVPKEEVYDVLATEEGQQRAFDKLDTIREDIVWFDSWSQAPQLLADGGANLVQSANGRFYAAIVEEGQPFEMIWDGMVFDLDVWAILKGAPNRDAAWEFIKFATSTVPLSGMQDVAYGPTRKSSEQYVDEDVLNRLPTAHLEEGIKADAVFWADYGESLGEKFNQWLLAQ